MDESIHSVAVVVVVVWVKDENLIWTTKKVWKIYCLQIQKIGLQPFDGNLTQFFSVWTCCFRMFIRVFQLDISSVFVFSCCHWLKFHFSIVIFWMYATLPRWKKPNWQKCFPYACWRYAMHIQPHINHANWTSASEFGKHTSIFHICVYLEYNCCHRYFPRIFIPNKVLIRNSDKPNQNIVI